MSERRTRRSFLGLAGRAAEFVVAHKALSVVVGGILLEGGNAALNRQRTLESIAYVEKFLSPVPPYPPYDAIVVLGAGNSGEDGQEVPADDGKMRVIAAVEEYRRHPAQVILFSGGARNGTAEAKVMRKFAKNYAPTLDFAWDEETESVDTVTELRQLIKWLKQHPEIKRIGVVTNAYHIKGVQVLGHNLGIDLFPIVAEQVLLDTGNPDLIKRVDDFRDDSSFTDKIDKEKARLFMLVWDPESHFSQERIDWQNQDPRLKPIFDKMFEVLVFAGKKWPPLDLKQKTY